VTVVEFFRRRPTDGVIERFARVSAEAGGPLTVEALHGDDPTSVEALLRRGVPGPTGEMLYPADGEAFVRALPDVYRGSMLWAEFGR